MKAARFVGRKQLPTDRPTLLHLASIRFLLVSTLAIAQSIKFENFGRSRKIVGNFHAIGRFDKHQLIVQTATKSISRHSQCVACKMYDLVKTPAKSITFIMRIERDVIILGRTLRNEINRCRTVCSAACIGVFVSFEYQIERQAVEIRRKRHAHKPIVHTAAYRINRVMQHSHIPTSGVRIQIFGKPRTLTGQSPQIVVAVEHKKRQIRQSECKQSGKIRLIIVQKIGKSTEKTLFQLTIETFQIFVVARHGQDRHRTAKIGHCMKIFVPITIVRTFYYIAAKNPEIGSKSSLQMRKFIVQNAMKRILHIAHIDKRQPVGEIGHCETSPIRNLRADTHRILVVAHRQRIHISPITNRATAGRFEQPRRSRHNLRIGCILGYQKQRSALHTTTTLPRHRTRLCAIAPERELYTTNSVGRHIRRLGRIAKPRAPACAAQPCQTCDNKQRYCAYTHNFSFLISLHKKFRLFFQKKSD